jgi:hypothetical protein
MNAEVRYDFAGLRCPFGCIAQTGPSIEPKTKQLAVRTFLVDTNLADGTNE